MRYLTLGSVWKYEEKYALDFVRYHRSVGVEHFVILDRKYDAIAEMFKNDSDVEVIHFPENPGNVHAEGWARLIGMNKGKTQWLACIDADQALVPARHNDIKDILKPFEAFASLQVNWHTFASGGALTMEPGSLYERFLMRAKSDAGVNNHTQFICQPERTLALKTHDPHHPRLDPKEISVNTGAGIVTGPFSAPPRHDILWCAHYITKSREEWLIKNAKGRADIFGQKMPMDMFDDFETYANAEREERVLELWNKIK